MDWQAPAIVLTVRRYGEADLLATVLTESFGSHRGLVRGGASRAAAPVWQPGNLLEVRWAARLAEQLGSLSGELVHPAAALAMPDAMALAMLSSCCAVAEGALPERAAHPRVFAGLVPLIAGLGQGEAMLADLVRWEATLLGDLGYGLDLERCGVTGATEGLAYVSPRTGRAVSAAAAGTWAPRLLALPGFLLGQAATGPAAWRDGLLLTGHFLARDAFGTQHQPLPPARVRLQDRVAAIAR